MDGYEKDSVGARIIVTTDAAEYICVRAAAGQKKEFAALQVGQGNS